MSIKRLSILELAALMAAILVVWASQPVAAAAPRANDASQPRIMEQAARLGEVAAMRSSLQGLSAPSATRSITGQTASPKVQREVFGFVNAGNLGDPGVGYPSWNLGLLTTVAFFGLHVNSGDGHIITWDSAWAVYHSGTMSSFVNAAHAAGVRVIVSLNLHDTGTNPDNQVCQGLIPANAQTTINEAATQVAAAGIDGVNVNYEGTITTCANGQSSRTEMTAFVKNLRTRMPTSYIAIDTYTGSAEDNLEFFDVTGLQPYVDSYFVMAYDMDYDNGVNPPVSCPSYCFNPVSALNTYRFNATSSMAQYTALVPRSQIILGQPYYGRSGCVAQYGPPAHQALFPGKGLLSPRYLDASSGLANLTSNRDPGDGVSEWDSYSTNECNRRQYWDDTVSLSAKYDLVNRDDLRGVGLFTLDYAGGAPEVWSILATHFSQIPGAPGSVSACAGTLSASVSWTAAPTSGGPITSYRITANPGAIVATVPGDATFAIVTGLTAGTTYTVTVQGVNSSGQGVGSTVYSVTPIAGAPVYTGYFSWFDKVTGGMVGDNIHLLNPGTTPNAGCVVLSGRLVVPFSLAAGEEQHMTLPSVIGGPIVVTVNTGPAVLASQRVQYFQSFNEVWAMTAAQAATTSYINWFDTATPGMVGDNIHVVNPGGPTATGTVSLGGISIGFSLGPGAETHVTFPVGRIGGPVKITADQPVLASSRVQYFQSFNEVVARSAAQATTTSYFNWYDTATGGMVGDNIHVLNPGTSVATGTVSLGGSPLSFKLGPGEETHLSFSVGRIGGPVTVTSDQPVLASQRVQYFQSFNEVASVSAAQAQTTSYVMWFDKATPGMVGDNIHILNPGTSSAIIAVGFGGGSFTFGLDPGIEAHITYGFGHIGGPVSVISNVPVIVAQRVQYFQSFNEAPAG